MHPDIVIRQQDKPAASEVDFVSKQFRAFNDQTGGVFPSKSLHLFAYGSNKQVIGGLFGDVSWGWLHVDVIWVDEQYRHAGIGNALMDKAEAEAIGMGIEQAYLETADFQALDFYLKRGYEIFAQLEDQPPGHVCYYLKKMGLSKESG